MKKSQTKVQFSALGLALVLFVSLAYFAFGLPTITFQPPTLSENATTGSNWTYVNLTSDEPLNQSFLEWGNSSGFTNVTMDNTTGSATNWYVNMTDLADGTCNYTIWAENTTGDWNRTHRKYIIMESVI